MNFFIAMNGFKTTKQLFRNILSIILIGFLAVFSSCEKGEEPIPPVVEPAKYIIKGQVLNQQTSQPLQGVAVKMGTLTATTSANGEFEFKDLTEAGKYTLTFAKEDFFNASYSLEFQAAEPNQVISFSITVSMVPYVEGVTPITPSEGGVVRIDAEVPVTLTIPAATTVTDANNQPVTGPINITAIEIPDIVTPTEYNPGLVTLQFGPAGLKFSNPLPVVVDNPFSSSVYFEEIQLEYFNETLNKWEVQPQPVTYISGENKYRTTIDHFSRYKFSIHAARTILSSLEENITVIDSPIENRGSTSQTVESITVERKSGYIFTTPVETVLTNAGISASDIPGLKTVIEDVVKLFYSRTSAASSLITIEDEISINRTIQANHKLVTTGRQAIDRHTYRFLIAVDTQRKVLDFEVHSANAAVTLNFQDLSIDDHGHGGGGSN